MNFELKRLGKDAVPAALAKAQHYRLLNEPRQAESICRDVLAADPDNRKAVITLVLALTDQFAGDTANRYAEAKRLLEGFPENDYERHYYAGLVCERRATAYLESQLPASTGWAYDWYRQAMEAYERAESVRPAGNDDALLRWNTCARIIMQNRLEKVVEQSVSAMLE